MKTAEFIKIAQKIQATGLIRVAKKGEHSSYLLGTTCIGSTDTQNQKLWRKYGCLNNIIIFKTATEANQILFNHNITEFVAIPTKSKTMCRLKINN